MRRKTTMLELLTWAYRDELPKRDVQGYGGGWGAVERAGDGGGYDSPPPVRAPVALGAPHPDAEWLSRQVQALPVLDVVEGDAAGLSAALEAAEILLGPMSRLLDRETMRHMATRKVSLPVSVQSLALGIVRPPSCEAWRAEPLRNKDGYVVVLNERWTKQSIRIGGRTARLNVMTSGECPVRWSPDLIGVFEERMRWCLLVDALELLERASINASRSGELLLWHVQGTGIAVEPWRGDVHRALKGRLLPDLAGPQQVAMTVDAKPAPQRGRPKKVALRPAMM